MMRVGDIVNDEGLAQALERGQYLLPEELSGALAYAKDKKATLSDVLLEQKFLTKDILGQAIADTLGVRYADEEVMPTDRKALGSISEELAKKSRVVVLKEDAVSVMLASDHPSEDLAASLAKLLAGKATELRYALPGSIDKALRLYDKSLASKFEELFGTSLAQAPDVVQAMLDHAADAKASDIHIEPRTAEALVRFRIDGVLMLAGRIPKAFFDQLLNRIKVQSQLPIDEHRRAQDGSFRYERQGGAINVRVSIAPTIEGEKVVMRLLSSYVGFTIPELGLSAANAELLDIAARKPFGMILTVGPTGSGKTTTLYAFLSMRNSAEVNITTIEDPVEYKIEGLNQIQTNQATELTFARGLRSIVRQDPDVVLVGEIRDRETAEIAVNAALTGHLLFSTFHSNDAATTVPRLLDMGIEPFLLASTLELIVAQRLARTICDACKVSYTLSVAEARALVKAPGFLARSQKSITLYKGQGCALCHGSGYRGRTGIFEMMHNTPEMQDLIATRPRRIDIQKLARSQGSRSLFDDGWDKVMAGTTTIEELMRVARPDSL